MNENKRLLQLFVVLLYDTDTNTTTGKSFLNAGQRICINQERAFLMRDFPEDEDFEQSPTVNEKITFIIQQIRTNNLSNAYLAHARTLIN